MRKQKLAELKSYIEELSTIEFSNVQQISQGFLSIRQMDCLLNNGHTIKREEMLKHGKNGSAAVILPITKDGNTLLVVQPRVFTHNTVGVGLPAGYIDQDEEPTAAALRELVEETGYVPEYLQHLVSYYQDQGCSGAYNHSFIAMNCENKGPQQLDKDEYIRYFECTFEEALELVEMDYINGANSILTLEKAKIHLLRRR